MRAEGQAGAVLTDGARYRLPDGTELGARQSSFWTLLTEAQWRKWPFEGYRWWVHPDGRIIDGITPTGITSAELALAAAEPFGPLGRSE